jgi:hypothetical protein
MSFRQLLNDETAAITLVAGLTAVSGLRVLGDMPAARRPRPDGIAGSTQSNAGLGPTTAAHVDDVIRQ